MIRRHRVHVLDHWPSRFLLPAPGCGSPSTFLRLQIPSPIPSSHFPMYPGLHTAPIALAYRVHPCVLSPYLLSHRNIWADLEVRVGGRRQVSPSRSPRRYNRPVPVSEAAPRRLSSRATSLPPVPLCNCSLVLLSSHWPAQLARETSKA
ncbi:hypothetical protein B0T18DRAFT_121220 [Schizothecium vesticola]|uniref:Uncharacterized protein n=1 Tax=Schizothecium vesticola TaxID=314040 RepID=A0AA40F2T7_9PEZI|nr:hypothetical protein B0T18DRAFT_121220 [Schizothecium vesticola]